MALPVVSLSSLASRVVLAKDLDTRELPCHLHREMEQYRRLRGDFTLLSIDLQVQRSDQGQVSEKQRTYSRGWLDKSVLGKMVSDCGLEMKVTGVNRWTATRGEGQTNLVFDRVDPANILHEIQACQQDMENRPNLNLYKYGYLENGKLLTVEKLEMFCPNVGLTTLTLNQSSFEIDETDCFVWVQKVQNLHTGLICIITVRQTRR